MVEFPYSLREGDEARARDASLQTSVLILVCTPWLMIALLILRKLSRLPCANGKAAAAALAAQGICISTP